MAVDLDPYMTCGSVDWLVDKWSAGLSSLLWASLKTALQRNLLILTYFLIFKLCD